VEGTYLPQRGKKTAERETRTEDLKNEKYEGVWLLQGGNWAQRIRKE